MREGGSKGGRKRVSEGGRERGREEGMYTLRLVLLAGN